MNEQRLQKVLAQAGIGSRREIEKLISQGQIFINDKKAQLGDKVIGTENIRVANKKVNLDKFFQNQQSRLVIILNKPIGFICSKKEKQMEDIPSVFKLLPAKLGVNLIMVGRLDLNTSGLLIFTNDGELAQRLTHPSYQIEREYLVRILGEVSPDKITKLTQGIQIEGVMSKFTNVIPVDEKYEKANHNFIVKLKSGKNHEVKKLWEAVGTSVSRLKRISYGSFTLNPKIRAGSFELAPKEAINQMVRILKLDRKDIYTFTPEERALIERQLKKNINYAKTSK